MTPLVGGGHGTPALMHQSLPQPLDCGRHIPEQADGSPVSGRTASSREKFARKLSRRAPVTKDALPEMSRVRTSLS
jgi:hypothetical protein